MADEKNPLESVADAVKDAASKVDVSELTEKAGHLADQTKDALKNVDVDGIAQKAKDVLPDQADKVIDDLSEKLK